MNSFQEIKIRIYKATDNLNACQKFSKGHSDVLKSYGIKKVTSANTEWFNDSDVYIIMVESNSGEEIYGGARFHLKNTKFLLPIEEAIGDIDSNIFKLTNKNSKYRTAEMCGLWNSRKMSGSGISAILTRVSVAKAAIFLAEKLELDSIFILCAPWTLNMVKKVGFTIETSLGNNGGFMYPKPDLIATVCTVNDVKKLTKANSFERELIFDLRKNPKQKKLEDGPNGIIEVEYNLITSEEEIKIVKL